MTATDYTALEQAYNEAVQGTRQPPCMVASGAWIMRQCPDLELALREDQLYFITKDGIIEMIEQ